MFIERDKTKDQGCVVLIGMPAVGKTTVAQVLAQKLDFIHCDSDYIIESLYGVPLQTVTDNLTKEAFLDLESEVIEGLRLKSVVLSTGGSVVYREKAMQKLKEMGICFFLSADLELILERIAINPDRGLAIAPGQSVEDLYNERMALYKKYADYTIEVTADLNPDEVASLIFDKLILELTR